MAPCSDCGEAWDERWLWCWSPTKPDGTAQPYHKWHTGRCCDCLDWIAAFIDFRDEPTPEALAAAFNMRDGKRPPGWQDGQ